MHPESFAGFFFTINTHKTKTQLIDIITINYETEIFYSLYYNCALSIL